MLSDSHDSTIASNLENIALLNRVRLIAIIGQVILIAFSLFYLEIQLPLIWLVGLIRDAFNVDNKGKRFW